MTTRPDDIEIRRAESVADYHACQRAQRRAWGIQDDAYLVPIATMAGAQHHGGLVLGAFLPDGEAVGLSFAFLGRADGRLCLYSQLTGIIPGYQDRGLGGRMKTVQRAFARDENIPCIAWAFDPLQAGNARFNLDKLGASCARYLVDMYGPRTDALNRNTPTDRLIAVWETEPFPPRRFDAETIAGMPRIIASRPTPEGFREPVTHGRSEGESLLLLEIPIDIHALRANHPGLADRWGRAVREGFLAAFAAGFVALGFQRDAETACYVLERPLAPNGSASQAEWQGPQRT